jgi:hypothetical protein
MKLKVFEVIVAEGTEIECALYTHVLIDIFRMKSEFDKKKEVEDWMKKFGDMTIDELMKREREEEE